MSFIRHDELSRKFITHPRRPCLHQQSVQLLLAFNTAAIGGSANASDVTTSALSLFVYLVFKLGKHANTRWTCACNDKDGAAASKLFSIRFCLWFQLIACSTYGYTACGQTNGTKQNSQKLIINVRTTVTSSICFAHYIVSKLRSRLNATWCEQAHKQKANFDLFVIKSNTFPFRSVPAQQHGPL